jgi:hypothetical protein
MKTKLTLFVTVLAVASFGTGCASTDAIEKPPAPVPDAVKWNGHWYAVINEDKNCQEAREHCKKLGGHLLIIETEEENKFIHDLGIKNSLQWCHLGARRYQLTGSSVAWIWDNGIRISESYQNFVPDKTAGPWHRLLPDRTCLKTLLEKEGDRAGKWHSNTPVHANNYICEWE